MTDPGGQLPAERPDIIRRLERFLAVFGIVYGLLGTIEFLSQCRQWRSWLRIVTGGYGIERGYLIGGFLLDASYVWLAIASIAFLRGRPRAVANLFAWAVLALSIEVFREFSSVYRQLLNLPETLRWLIDSLARAPMRWGFPIMLLCILVLRSGFRVPQRGFSMLPPEADEPASSLQSAAPIRLFSYRLLQQFAIVGVIVSVLGLVQVNTQYNFWTFPVDNRTPILSPRRPVMDIVLQVRQLSHALLLCGAAATLLNRHFGQKLMLGWTLMFLATSVMQFALYDCLYVYWTLTHPQYQSSPEISAMHLLDALKLSSFAIIVFYVLIQPEIRDL